jgi:hypothetical protein
MWHSSGLWHLLVLATSLRNTLPPFWERSQAVTWQVITENWREWDGSGKKERPIRNRDWKYETSLRAVYHRPHRIRQKTTLKRNKTFLLKENLDVDLPLDLRKLLFDSFFRVTCSSVVSPLRPLVLQLLPASRSVVSICPLGPHHLFPIPDFRWVLESSRSGCHPFAKYPANFLTWLISTLMMKAEYFLKALANTPLCEVLNQGTAICISNNDQSDRLCGLVVRVLGYRSGGPSSIPGTKKK